MTVKIKPTMPRWQQAILMNRVTGRIAAAIFALIYRWRTRRAISHLTAAPDLMLKDLGISRSDIERVVRQGRR